jgi:hypothetical protein
VAVELDGNYIDAEPVKSQKAKDLTERSSNVESPWEPFGNQQYVRITAGSN